MPGPAPKPPGRRQRRNSRGGQVVPFGRGLRGPIAVPKCPKEFLAATKVSWESFWKSDLAQIVNPDTDAPAVLRLFTLYDERERAYRSFRRQRLIKGSQGQAVLNPMGRAMQEYDAEIRQMEDRLGLNVRSRLQLGITFGEAAKSLSDLNRMLDEDEESDADGDHGEEAPDPRQQQA